MLSQTKTLSLTSTGSLLINEKSQALLFLDPTREMF
jgi:hypothetical protein